MNKRGASDLLTSNIVYFLILMIFVSIMGIFVYSQRDGVALWEDYYSKEISRVLNSAKPGDVIYLDVTKATGIASNNKKNFNEVFLFNNEQNYVTVSLSPGSGKAYEIFNEIDIEEMKIEFLSESTEINRLYIKIGDKNE